MAETFKLALECVKALPEFDGSDKSQLPNFIQQVEAINPVIASCEDGFKAILFSYIMNKCTGKARQAIQNSDDVDNWPMIKLILKRTFGEKQSVTELMDQLKTLQLNGTIENYYSKIKNLIHKVNNSRLTHGDISYSIIEINRAGLATFKNHMPEPTKTLLLARNPLDLDTAYSIVVEARHQNFTQYGPQSLNINNGRNTGNRNSYSNNYRSNITNYNNSIPNYKNKNNDSNNYNNYNRQQSYDNNNYNNRYNINNRNTQQFESNSSSNTRQTNNSYNRRNNYNKNYQPNNYNNYNRNNNMGFPYPINGNPHQNRTFSQNTRRQLDEVVPMEIGQQGANFQAQASRDSPT